MGAWRDGLRKEDRAEGGLAEGRSCKKECFVDLDCCCFGFCLRWLHLSESLIVECVISFRTLIFHDRIMMPIMIIVIIITIKIIIAGTYLYSLLFLVCWCSVKVIIFYGNDNNRIMMPVIITDMIVSASIFIYLFLFLFLFVDAW